MCLGLGGRVWQGCLDCLNFLKSPILSNAAVIINRESYEWLCKHQACSSRLIYHVDRYLHDSTGTEFEINLEEIHLIGYD